MPPGYRPRADRAAALLSARYGDPSGPGNSPQPGATLNPGLREESALSRPFAPGLGVCALAVALAACGGTPAPRPTVTVTATPRATTSAIGMSATTACRYLDQVQAHYGLNSDRGRRALSYVANNAENAIGTDANVFLGHWSRSLSSPYEAQLANDCVRLTGTP